MSAPRGWRVAIVGATGAVGEELLHVLEERSFPLLNLQVFASGESEGREVDFRGETLEVQRLGSSGVRGADLVFCAAPRVLEDLLPALREEGARVIDVSGALELDPSVPLYLPGDPVAGLGVEVAVPRGIVAGLALALRPIQAEVPLEQVTVVTLESASGVGRRGVGELSDQTVQLLSTMTGETDEPEVFPQSLAFDCLPLVGDVLEQGESSEERRLGHVLRRLLGSPGLEVQSTRVRVPVFGGSLACLHASPSRAITVRELRELWEKVPGLELLDEGKLPTPRTRTGQDELAIGRIRVSSDRPGVAFVLAMDDLRRGAALACVEAAELLIRD